MNTHLSLKIGLDEFFVKIDSSANMNNDLTTKEREAKLQKKAQEMIDEINHYIELGEAKLKEIENKKP